MSRSARSTGASTSPTRRIGRSDLKITRDMEGVFHIESHTTLTIVAALRYLLGTPGNLDLTFKATISPLTGLRDFQVHSEGIDTRLLGVVSDDAIKVRGYVAGERISTDLPYTPGVFLGEVFSPFTSLPELSNSDVGRTWSVDMVNPLASGVQHVTVDLAARREVELDGKRTPVYRLDFASGSTHWRVLGHPGRSGAGAGHAVRPDDPAGRPAARGAAAVAGRDAGRPERRPSSEPLQTGHAFPARPLARSSATSIIAPMPLRPVSVSPSTSKGSTDGQHSRCPSALHRSRQDLQGLRRHAAPGQGDRLRPRPAHRRPAVRGAEDEGGPRRHRPAAGGHPRRRRPAPGRPRQVDRLLQDHRHGRPGLAVLGRERPQGQRRLAAHGRHHGRHSARAARSRASASPTTTTASSSSSSTAPTPSTCSTRTRSPRTSGPRSTPTGSSTAARTRRPTSASTRAGSPSCTSRT